MEPQSDHEDEDMKVVDAVDDTQSEHDGSEHEGSGGESEFSRSLSRSPSLSGSVDGSFSGSLSLSSFTASNTSLGKLFLIIA